MSGTPGVIGISDDRLLHMRGVAERASPLYYARTDARSLSFLITHFVRLALSI